VTKPTLWHKCKTCDVCVSTEQLYCDDCISDAIIRAPVEDTPGVSAAFYEWKRKKKRKKTKKS